MDKKGGAGAVIFTIIVLVILLFLGAYGYKWLIHGSEVMDSGITTESALQRANQNNPFTAPEKIQINSGGEKQVAIGIFNEQMMILNSVNFRIVGCEAFNPSLSYVAQPVNGRESAGFVSTLTISEYELGEYSCKLEALTLGVDNSEKILHSKDIIIAIA
ncbi:hypothetical protein K9L97_01945 [Candidatus Woesearchaeota archaeon]|nr:hypothetical protein [Candidatus Woesearchaeota archaeon]